ncbi:MAG TPA: amidohydrolase family protein [Candidatus Ozemobacteraceae bacterium]|nr:amidohydrolase family protein [Candidatus Ozemobacteraceae bacterium]
MYDLVIRNALLMDGWNEWRGDLAVSGETIAAVGTGLSGRREIDAAGKWLMPGAIDAHVHLSLPFAGAVSADDFETGSRAAAFGGVTTMIDFTAQQGDEGLRPGFERRRQAAEGKAVIDWSVHACIGRLSKQVLADLDWAVGAGLTSLKFFTAYGRSGLMLDDGAVFELMTACRAAGILPTVHAETGAVIDRLFDGFAAAGTLGIEILPRMRPVFTETEAIRRIADLARAAGAAAYIVHVSSGDGAAEIARARRDGARLFGETCPQYLTLDDTLLTEPDGQLYACCPPVRPAGQPDKLWEQLRTGAIQVVATDHCPFTKAAKNTWGGRIDRLPMGLPGIETMPALVLSEGRKRGIPANLLVRAMTAAPARLFGLDRKGRLNPGCDADLMLYDPDEAWTVTAAGLHMATDYSIYEGRPVRGRPVMTISRGEIIVDRHQWLGTPGRGRFLPRKPFDHATVW